MPQHSPRADPATKPTARPRPSSHSVDLAAIRAMAARLEAAARTLHALPPDSRLRPAGTRSAWPDFIQKSRFLAGQTRMLSRACPSPAAIDDADRLLDLLWDLDADQRRLVWARACHMPWAVLASRLGRSRSSLNRDHRLALARLCAAAAVRHPEPK